ncbi:MAG TPA: hypothetical protein VHW03_05225 [Chthoniobacterales bacterium]|jgi:hypothetical protein|nr:hypothetical protein [Chthoniobacterales bacterium]
MAKERGEPTTSSSLRSASRYVRRSAPAICARNEGIGKPIARRAAESSALCEWAALNEKRLPFNFVEQFKPVTAGAEHRVYYDEKNGLAIKATHPNTFGHSAYGPGARATPSEYLRRLRLCNDIFGDNFEIVGIAFDEDGQVEVVSSQRWIESNPIRAVPFAEEIDAYFYRFGFFRSRANPDAPLFYHMIFDLLVADAHDTNILRDAKENFAAIDVVVGTPGPALRKELREGYLFAERDRLTSEGQAKA